MHEIRMAAQAAEERIRQDGEASAYDVDDIRTMTEEAENLVKEPCCENIHTMRVIMGAVSQNLLKMQGTPVLKWIAAVTVAWRTPKIIWTLPKDRISCQKLKWMPSVLKIFAVK